MSIISLCDGKNSLLDIAEILSSPIWELYEIIEILVSHQLLKENE